MKIFQLRPYPTTKQVAQAKPAHTGTITSETKTKWITGAIIGSALIMYFVVA